MFDDKWWDKVKMNGWTMTISVIVQKTVPRTYFKTVGIVTGGYVGFTHEKEELSIKHCAVVVKVTSTTRGSKKYFRHTVK